ncbi:hypothetical protein DU490_16935 [Halomonas sp. DQ26W]|uniref:hypothetical protein n=1 Tax=Halomonas sp. DQ26W TaxID=2282311 RepID=UPI000DF82B36|nr:hypothetical protein [Halomonas sp. DQ26W]RDB41727.1 hypothetical protein DU490_16935 [Halomonas sp. DQ26W]
MSIRNIFDNLTPSDPMPTHSLKQRLAQAKIQLDSLELDGGSKDLSALSAARVEFALAARALADELIARGHHSERSDS